MTKLRKIWDAGKPSLNAWCSIGNAFTAEIMAAQGFDSVTVDMQHGALDYSDLLPMLQAMRGSGATLLARVPWLDPAHVMKALDAGAEGIICPMVNTGDEAAALVSYMRYPPHGTRSFGPTRAAFAHGAGYAETANARLLAFAMVETAEGFANLDAIAATPGLDGIYVGPTDLTLSLSAGRLAPKLDRDEPEMVAALQRIAAACQAHGIIAALHCGTADYANRAIGWGYRMVTVGGDTRFLSAAAAAAVAEFRSLSGTTATEATRAAY
ncbi:2,4-dihydroxyhept-2-ene-1,7-dioic acid aldolase [Tabrizicola piscis]|jgi:4-hydroxy-2-oxoheptanedioate aldolase|uniref:2,4-dihydroxyhept-2-ene-1,7-dioic acid aldolase n=1 Tax=Tabrizicola piscis TaxID=2494374 RepID=A0A3S8U661_9RHOB|nr:aldolase/citrate lyase family protein [Tabrizicola piscis]AZL59152.1 2,4-dihydroxyhept-2-ene-1,7-dioic acid aldolase [Tabrizicola piscis]